MDGCSTSADMKCIHEYMDREPNYESKKRLYKGSYIKGDSGIKLDEIEVSACLFSYQL